MLGLDPEMGRGELFGELLPGALERSGADAIYVPSAPSGGERPFRPDRGVANYYGVGGYRRPLTDARLAGVRFAAECLAFANVPDEAGVEAVLPAAPADVVVHHPRWKAGVPRDAGTGWDFDDVRDHYLRELFGVDPAELRRYDHERYLELSRGVSAEAMSAVFGEWRRAGSPCGGGLVLWLRDLMPGAGWGLVDHAGEPKAALAALSGVLSPVAVWMTDEGLAGVGVHIANDRAAPLRAILRIGLYADSGHPVGGAREEVVIEAHGNVSQDLESMIGGFADVSWAYRFGPPALASIVATLEARGGAVEPLAQAVFFPGGPPVRAESATAFGLSADAEPDAEGLTVGLRADRLVYGLAVEGPGTRLGHRWICLEPGVERRVRLATLGHYPNLGSIRVTASNLDGRLSVGFGPQEA
jgi:beta-mannosidase